MRYAVQAASKADNIAYDPDEIDGMKKQLDIEQSNSKLKNSRVKEGRERRKKNFNSTKEARKQRSNHTRECANIQTPGSYSTRRVGVEQIYKHRNRQTYSATTNTRRASKK